LAAIIADFGKNKDGLNLLRINGTKEEIEKAIQNIKDVGCEVYEVYDYEKAHKHWSVLIRIKIPEEDQAEKEA
jgi:hypothetical protein